MRFTSQLASITVAAFATAAMTTTAFAGTPHADITTLDTSGMAPFTVHVHALGSTMGNGTRITARFEWDFDDDGADYNELEGWNAAHTYDEPGSYTIVLRLTNEDGEVDTDTVNIWVGEDTRERLYVSEDGSDSNSGASPSQPIRTYNRMEQLLEDDMTVLFKRGDVFDVNDTGELHRRNWVMGAYGNGSAPTIRWTGSLDLNQLVVLDENNARDVLIEDLRFDSIHSSTQERNIVSCIAPGGQNVTVRDCEFRHVTDAINCNREPVGVLVQDNRATIDNGLRAYFAWVSGSDQTYLGNVVNGSLHEHNIRVSNGERINISMNDLTNSPKTSIWAMKGSNVWMGQNELHEGPVTIGPNPHSSASDSFLDWVVFERNTVDHSFNGVGAVQLKFGLEHTMLRNNVLTAHGMTCIDMLAFNETYPRDMQEIYILNNTGINNDQQGRFLAINNDSDHVEARNNLYSAPSLVTGTNQTASVYVQHSSLEMFDAMRRNVWATPDDFEWVSDGYHYVWPFWSHASGYRSISEWNGFGVVDDEAYARIQLSAGYVLPSGSVARTHARPVDGVHTDFYGADRPSSGTWIAGAVREAPDDLRDPDLDSDGTVGVTDLVILVGEWGENGPADLDSDGAVGANDLVILLGAWDASDGPVVDLDGDGIVGIADLLIVLSEWGEGNKGDLTGDGIVNIDDLLLILFFWEL